MEKEARVPEHTVATREEWEVAREKPQETMRHHEHENRGGRA